MLLKWSLGSKTCRNEKKVLGEKFSESKMGEAREIFFFCQNVPVGPKRVKNVKKKKIVKNFQSPTLNTHSIHNLNLPTICRGHTEVLQWAARLCACVCGKEQNGIWDRSRPLKSSVCTRVQGQNGTLQWRSDWEIWALAVTLSSGKMPGSGASG